MESINCANGGGIVSYSLENDDEMAVADSENEETAYAEDEIE